MTTESAKWIKKENKKESSILAYVCSARIGSKRKIQNKMKKEKNFLVVHIRLFILIWHRKQTLHGSQHFELFNRIEIWNIIRQQVFWILKFERNEKSSCFCRGVGACSCQMIKNKANVYTFVFILHTFKIERRKIFFIIYYHLF